MPVTRSHLERHQIAIYLGGMALGAVVGLAAPGPSRGLEVLVTPAIAVLMYAMFLQMPLLNLHGVFGNRRFIGALLVANFVFIPPLVWALTAHLVEHRAIRIGAVLALMTPCIDYVVVLTHQGKGDGRLILSATPLLLLLQFALLMLFLQLGGGDALAIPFAPFMDAFLYLIAVPLALVALTEALGMRHRIVARWRDGWSWLPVPATTLVLVLVVGSQISRIAADAEELVPLLPVYLAFAVIAPFLGALVARMFRLGVPAARAVAFSTASRNSLVVLPLALALPEHLKLLAATAVITQTVIELLSELVYLKAIPRLVPDD